MKKWFKKTVAVVLTAAMVMTATVPAFAAQMQETKAEAFTNAVMQDEYLTDLEYSITDTATGSIETGTFTSMGQMYSYVAETDNQNSTVTIKVYEQSKTKVAGILTDEFIIDGQNKSLIHNGEEVTIETITEEVIHENNDVQLFSTYPSGAPAYEEHTTAVVRDWFYSRVIDIAVILLGALVTTKPLLAVPYGFALDIAEELVRDAIGNNVPYSSPALGNACQKVWIATFPDDGSYCSIRYDYETKYYQGYHYGQIGSTWTDMERYW